MSPFSLLPSVIWNCVNSSSSIGLSTVNLSLFWLVSVLIFLKFNDGVNVVLRPVKLSSTSYCNFYLSKTIPDLEKLFSSLKMSVGVSCWKAYSFMKFKESTFDDLSFKSWYCFLSTSYEITLPVLRSTVTSKLSLPGVLFYDFNGPSTLGDIDR